MATYTVLTSFFIIASLLPFITSKIVNCRYKFPGGVENEHKLWSYCTKFGTAKQSKYHFTMKSQFLSSYMKTSEEIYSVDVGIY